MENYIILYYKGSAAFLGKALNIINRLKFSKFIDELTDNLINIYNTSYRLIQRVTKCHPVLKQRLNDVSMFCKVPAPVVKPSV